MRRFLFGLQMLLVAFGATVLVPYLTGVPVSIALFTAGVGTLIAHFITKWKVPVFLGSSFAYIAPMIATFLYYANKGGTQYASVQQAINAGFNPMEALPYVTGGILIAGLVKILGGLIIGWIGIDRFRKVFTPVLSGSVIVLIGLTLAPVAVSMASTNWFYAVLAIFLVFIFKLLWKKTTAFNVILAVVVTYAISAMFGDVSITWSGWFAVPEFYLPKFEVYPIITILAVAICPMMESIGDVYVLSEVTGKDFYRDPGINRTLLADGVATSFAGAVGGCANTTYSECTATLAMTKNYDPWVMRIAAIIAIVFSFIPNISSVVQSIPQSIMGGIEMILFGLIASIGIRSISKVTLTTKDLLVMSVVLTTGLGGMAISVGNIGLSGIGLAAVIGIVVNIILMVFPKKPV